MSKETIIYEFDKDSEFYFEIMELWKVSFKLALGWTFFLDNKDNKEPVFMKNGREIFGIKQLKDKYRLIYTKNLQDVACF